MQRCKRLQTMRLKFRLYDFFRFDEEDLERTGEDKSVSPEKQFLAESDCEEGELLAMDDF